eukprot:Plantae.Rhodophyta-Hildenbrandia_rubra.ctg4362.p2 GENE.Plantae.Rhodophyta-Hildenbrandia_rubra.ctg4362~~Plantae.Rhodophyta-Hildenbrandia_rubra.ctg4362.p2  ORF type:complete len:474 (+),score=98.90 Plantae.Rhodophyta-Hildenbrandia_rubra.ctg4362:1025-2446(+)
MVLIDKLIEFILPFAGRLSLNHSLTFFFIETKKVVMPLPWESSAHPHTSRYRRRRHRTLHRQNKLTLAWLLILWVVLFDHIQYVTAGRDYYDILGVDRSADTATIKRAFRKLAMKYHPDKNPGDKNAEKLYVELSSAHEVLADEGKRRTYDQFGEEGVRQMREGDDEGGFGGGFGGFEDMFSGFFGGGGRRTREEREKKGEDLVVALSVSLEMLYNGEVISARQKRRVICSSWDDCEKRCPVCKGSGVVMQTRRLGPGFVEQRQVHCHKCGGRGKISTGNCKGCPKGQFEEVEKSIMIDIEAGMPDGHVIEFEGQADEIPDHTPGDLKFVIDTEDHDRFVRERDNLHYQLTISLAEALVGVDREVKQLDGRMVPIKTSKITKPNDHLVITGEGMPKFGTSKAGDMIVEFWVDFPKELTGEQKKSIIDNFGQPARASEKRSTESKSKSEFPDKSTTKDAEQNNASKDDDIKTEL